MPFQMALDEVLFNGHYESLQKNPNCVLPILRFFHSYESWVTVGYTHREEIPNPRRTCRRITGGGRVVHGKDLMFSLVAQKSADVSFGSVRLSYWKIHEAVKYGLELAGVKPRFYRVDENLPRGFDCFTFPIATDLALGLNKVAGGSQKRSRGIFLHQESVRLIPGISSTEFQRGLCAGFQKVFGVNLKPAPIFPSQLKEAQELSQKKYEIKQAVQFGYHSLTTENERVGNSIE
ncbi:MAG: lipoate--protein ligase family protein [Candidatus Omnitrophica bacterium]|nr:lipoate--protein ligase family protein [Candidatus Omnitrophota bacterium]